MGKEGGNKGKNNLPNTWHAVIDDPGGNKTLCGGAMRE